MKKLVLMFVAVAAISFASCGGNKTAQAEAIDTVEVEDTAVVDTVEADTVEVADTTAAE